MSKETEKNPITINIESLSFHFGDCHSTSFYNTDVDEETEMEFEDVGEDEEDEEAVENIYKCCEDEDTCECECCKDEETSDSIKHISEMPEKDKDFLKLIFGSILEELK